MYAHRHWDVREALKPRLYDWMKETKKGLLRTTLTFMIKALVTNIFFQYKLATNEENCIEISIFHSSCLFLREAIRISVQPGTSLSIFYILAK